ncbi:ABC transporter ATP-binding protein [Devosia algicola]|uniref:ABC transporter ATP-binding protein n=1 Tax=Devosia algicola TaxID=3026418 RepID=A0ABY7YNN1_9HYPH|nr:ABC transporter ATP-binding protein [Devosia algicola]WDR02649.1 ABC transporter ATP-binding protein [Devosia algicola]
MSLLAVNNLGIATGGQDLVADLSFAIEPGQRLGLIGESGSGKSLTAMAITGLLPPAIVPRGSVTLDGVEVIGAPERKLNQLRGAASAVVFQEPLTALDPLMKLGNQLAEPLHRRFRREGRDLANIDAEIIALLERVSLPQPQRIANAYPYEVSGGQRQRVAIAMALACRPKLLIADEPTTALDVTTQAEILALLDSLVRDLGMALLFISHDLPVVSTIVDQVLVLRQGRMVETGPVKTVLGAPQHQYTQSLVAAARAFDSALGAS